MITYISKRLRLLLALVAGTTLALMTGCATSSDEQEAGELLEGNVVEEGSVDTENAAEDPLAGDPLAGDPLAGDPLAGEEILDENSTTAGTDIVTEPEQSSFPLENSAGFAATPALPAADGLPSGENAALEPTAFTPTQTDTTVSNQAAPASGAAQMGGRVYYIAAASVELTSGPDAASNGTILSQGEPVLAKIEGQWANVFDRGWVRIDQISETPVGRAKSPKSWQ